MLQVMPFGVFDAQVTQNNSSPANMPHVQNLRYIALLTAKYQNLRTLSVPVIPCEKIKLIKVEGFLKHPLPTHALAHGDPFAKVKWRPPKSVDTMPSCWDQEGVLAELALKLTGFREHRGVQLVAFSSFQPSASKASHPS
mgnify:CR=1 FL=1